MDTAAGAGSAVGEVSDPSDPGGRSLDALSLTQEYWAWSRRLERARDENPDLSPPDWLERAGPYVERAVRSEADSVRSAALRWPQRLNRLSRMEPILVAVVGTSPPPALLSAQLLRPRLAVLASSNSAGEVVDETRRAMEALRPAPGRIIQVGFDLADPVAAYRVLIDAVDRALAAEGERPVVIDITGGTKSMAAAAFLVSVERPRWTAIYQEGGDYDRTLRRPAPCATRFHVLADPNEQLSLRSIRMARGYFDAFRYREAVDLLALELASLTDKGSFHVEGLARMRNVAEAMRSWAAGDYAAASAQFAALDLALPAAILPVTQTMTLAVGESGRKTLTKSADICFRYLTDAWTWAHRQLEGSAGFLRFWALGEMAIEQVVASMEDSLKLVTPGLEVARWDGFSSAMLVGRDTAKLQSKGVGAIVRRSSDNTEDKDDKGDFQVVLVRRSAEPMVEAKPWYDNRLRTIRNDCAHAFAAVDPEDLAHIASASRALLLAAGERLGCPVSEWLAELEGFELPGFGT